MLTFHQTTEAEMRRIGNWKYEGAYAIYDNQPYEEQLRQHRGFADPQNHYFSFCEGDRLIGYINLRETETEIRFGIGVDPNCCSQGYGQQMCKLARRLAKERYPQKPICIEVRTWNRRAVACYEKAGFRIVGDPFRKTTPIGEGLFYRMTAE